MSLVSTLQQYLKKRTSHVFFFFQSKPSTHRRAIPLEVRELPVIHKSTSSMQTIHTSLMKYQRPTLHSRNTLGLYPLSTNHHSEHLIHVVMKFSNTWARLS